ATSGVRDYWIGLTDSDICIGMHSVASSEHDCENTVKSEEIRNIFQNIQLGTPVTVKDPYGNDAAGGPSVLNAELCSKVCSNMWSYPTNIFDKSSCVSRCNTLGCIWVNDRCISKSITCDSGVVNNEETTNIYDDNVMIYNAEWD
ncbi:MAG TPA: hypothetical protein VJB05_02990, partial [archaeon]|nr:hypothetical protein [archaeon]